MRPINKGGWPVDEETGDPITFEAYGEARLDLLARIGDYCSYCENQITNPAVEHIQPKDAAPGIETNWHNFLLGCASCNSRKGDNWLAIENYYWADVHNTHLLFDFHPGGVVTVRATTHPSVDAAIELSTLELTGLQLFGGHTTAADRRWIKRNEAWGKAHDSLTYYVNSGHPPAYIQSITNMATSTGFWSVWMKVFDSRVEVQDALIATFNGTFGNCRIRDINR